MSKNKNKKESVKPSYEDAFFAQRSNEKVSRRSKLEYKNKKKQRNQYD